MGGASKEGTGMGYIGGGGRGFMKVQGLWVGPGGVGDEPDRDDGGYGGRIGGGGGCD